MRKILITALAAGAAVLASSCGGGGLGGAEGSLDAKTLSAVMTSLPFSTILSGMKFDGGAVSAPVSLPSGVGFAFAPTQYDGCTTKEGSDADADADGIVKGMTWTYNCNGINGNPGTLTRVGTYTETDLDDTKASIKGGFEYSFDFNNIYDAPHEYNEGIWSGSWSAKSDAKAITFKNQYYVTSRNIQRQGGVHPATDFTWQTDWTETYTPESMATPWDKGTIVWSGYLKLLGQLVANQTPYEINVVYSVDAKVTYDRVGCAGGYFKNGTITFTDAADNVVKYAYSNCTLTRTINGQTL